MKAIILLAFSCSLLNFTSKEQKITTDNLKGIVCLKIDACDMMIVCLKNGNYSVCEDYYDKCEEDDILVGEFQSYGFKDVYNITRDKSCRVYIEDWETSEESALEELKEECD